MAQRDAVRSKGFRAFVGTQFLGAFNDNVFKLLIVFFARNVLADSAAFATFVALANAVFTLPFIVLSPYAGFIADRVSKRTMMIWIKVAEIAIMILGVFALFTRDLKFMLGVLFLMAAQSAFFGPAKYGFLPEALPDEELSYGNGRVQFWTFLAIIAGMVVAGPLFTFFDRGVFLGGAPVAGFRGEVYLAAIFCVAVAVLGAVASLGITRVRPAGSRTPFQLNFMRSIWQTVAEVHLNRPLFLCLMGSCYFWFVGAIFQMNVLIYTESIMGVDENRTSMLLAAVGLGVGVGSMLAGRWSGEKIEFGLVPLGALGLGVFSVLLAFSAASFGLTALLLLALGASAGLYNIPLHSYIQQQSPADSKGRILATSNAINFISILLAAGVLYVLHDVLGLNSALVFLVIGLLSFVVIAYIIHLLPDFLLRFLVWLLTHTVYRITIVGQRNVPKTGGALLVCNHVSYADAFLVQASIQRFIRFVVARQFYDAKWLHPFCRLMGAIPVSPGDGPKTLQAKLEQASEKLRDGEVVCIFAEGAITRTGNLLPFNKGLEIIMRDLDVPIIPVYLDRMWGSLFSFEGGRILNRLPTRLPYPVTVAFGKPLPARSTAFGVRCAVSELGAEAFGTREDHRELLSTRFFRQARRRPRAFCMADSRGRELTYSQAMVAAMAMSKAVGRRCIGEEMVGIMLPASVGAALLNIAVTILGKVPVNLNFTASEEAVAKAIDNCGIRTIFSSREFVEKAKLPEREGMVFLEDFRHQVTAGDKVFSWCGFQLLPQRLLRLLYRADRRRHRDSLATVMFSSGSTGDPKGIMLSHANINSNIEALYQVVRLGKGDKVMGILPLFHSFGLTGTLWFPLTTGLGVVFHGNPLDFKLVGELTEKYRAAILTATPTFLMGYLRKCSPEQFASLRYVIVGAEKLSNRLADAFEERFGVRPLEGYGCTELSPIVAVNMPDVRRRGIKQKAGKSGSIGHPVPGVAVRIVDPETMALLPPDEDGLLLVKGPNVMLGYLNHEEKTREVMHEDWYVTGDIASVDRDGFITIKDRLSRFSKIGGEMVPHLRIEEEIHALLGIAGEQVCVVTAVPDETRGEKLTVLYKEGAFDVGELHGKLRGVGLPNLWVPRQEAFFAIPEIPVLGTGKLDLKAIKTRALELAARP